MGTTGARVVAGSRTIHHVKVWLYATLLAASFALPSFAADEAPKVKPRLIAEPSGLEPGKTTWIGVHFEIQPEWHIYWNGLNDTGFEPRVKWSLPEGLTAGEMLWPAPKRKVAAGFILDHIYEDEVTLLVPIAVSEDFAAKGPLELKAKLEWLVCQEACIPEEAEVKLSLPVGPGKPANPDDAKLMETSRARLPKPVTDLLKDSKNSLDVSIMGEDAGVVFEVPGAKALRYYPLNGGSALKDPIGGAEAEGQLLKIELAATKAKSDQDPYEVIVTGVLEVDSGEGSKAWYRIEERRADRRD
jgi:DsbC/DsbD-like thiol-disulfide interchange protein